MKKRELVLVKDHCHCRHCGQYLGTYDFRMPKDRLTAEEIETKEVTTYNDFCNECAAY